MIDAFESTARTYPNKVFLTFVDALGNEASYTYRQTRLMAAAVAQRLRGKGVRRGDCVSVDLPNCAEYVFLALAAAYGSFSLVCLNNRLTSTEKLTRLLELEREGARVAYRVDGARVGRLMASARTALTGESRRGSRTIMGAERDALEDAIHFAEREAHLFNAAETALIMFTSGTTGKAKAVPLTWRQLTGSAKVSNRALGERGRGMWQAVLPLYHIGGFQVLVRSVVGWTPLRLYERFDAKRVLSDACEYGATHISVVDKMLQDMLAVEEERRAAAAMSALEGAARGVTASRQASPSVERNLDSLESPLTRYQCILLGGGPLNARTVRRALDVDARVYASYGMTETSSQIANTLITPEFAGGLRLLSGYTACIIDPDEQGFGKLAVRGPGVFSGYLNAHAAFTVDGYFLTGDTAALYKGAIYVRERTSDMFVSGGENVYPAEIVAALTRISGVADAHVFGVPDATWGRRPVAIVECDAGAQVGCASQSSHGENAQARRASQGLHGEDAQAALTPQGLREALSPVLSKLYMPRHFCIVDELPRTGIGKIDRRAAEGLYENRLQIDHVVLHHVRLPFKAPFKTARETLTERDTLIVEVVDHRGRTGLGECVSFTTDWYLPETLGQDARVLRDKLIPLVCTTAFLHPREVSRLFSCYEEARSHPIACSALEMALWDLYGKITRKPLWKLVYEEYALLKEKLSASPALPSVSASGASGAYASDVRASGTSGAMLGDGFPIARSEGRAGFWMSGVGASSVGARGATASSMSNSVRVFAGAVVGIGSPAETVETVRECVRAGYSRVKLKISPGEGLASVKAVRDAFPDLAITLDANQSFSPCDVDELRQYDDLRISWIEEPIDVAACGRCQSSAFLRLAGLQRTIKTPLCLDESFTDAAEAYAALEFPELRCVAVKLGKFGGIEPSLEFIAKAHSLGREVWLGGMYDTGISKRAHAAVQTLPDIEVPGDIGATSRYFDVDITQPDYEVERGCVVLNERGYEGGLGCVLDGEAMAKVLVKRVVVR